MSDPAMNLANGDVSAYALACGYCQDWTADGTNRYYNTDANGVRLASEGNAFHVYVTQGDRTHNPDTGAARWIPTDHGSVRADWHTFDTLGEARRFWRTVRALIRKGEPVPYPS